MTKKTDTKKQVITEASVDGGVTDNNTEARKTLAPGSREPMKMQAIQDFLGLINGAEGSVAMKAFAETMAKFGPNGNYGVGDNSEKNRESVQTHNPIREALRADIDGLFDGSQTITEEFKIKATTLFEAAINSKVQLEVTRLEEEYQEKLETESEDIYQFLTEKMNDYVSYVADQWIADNQVAIDDSLRTELSDSFMEGIKSVFTDHYIDIPEAKVDVVEQLAKQVDQLESKLNETINDNIELAKEVSQYTKQKAINDLTEGLTVVQAEKVRTLAEGVEFEGDVDVYNEKLNVVKESIVTPTKEKKAETTGILNEEFEGGEDTNKIYLTPEMRNYVGAISRTTVK